ncbi:putative bifunctional diguanylate cyclase/phosphodiesterase [Deinococcus sp. Marseille-Q6407]|uniref:putative bifunctional diguanylate cyclase/phosphodiesterase n=1 Tax=Deinococcus sp. Marseille-Q6407 TaxID=2969223 RepID=UPI0021C016BA|nr:GGDEF domain-containing phosphodiesterase [Deinococcus sp. Marseille-Q6407]
MLARVAEQQGDLGQALELVREQRDLEQTVHTRDVQRRTAALTLQARVGELRHRAEVERLRRVELAEANLILRETEVELRYRATHDQLTGLMNRSWLHERLSQLLEVRAPQEEKGLILVNLDCFREINDRYGYASGDQVLVAVAQRLLALAGDTDLVGRVSGDEFAVLACGIAGAADLNQRAERILRALQESYNIEPYQIELRVSVATVLAPLDSAAAAQLFQNVDLAMTQAKRAAGSRVLAYTPALSVAEAERRRLERELRRAVSGGELTLHYQPQFELPGRHLTGYEALVRWNSSRLGQVSPAAFIPLAEETGVIVELGYWVLHEACRQAATWDFGQRGLSMAVNVSVRQFEQPEFVERVVQTLEECGLPGSRLVLELTESLVLHDKDLAGRHIAALRSHGIRIAIDDFGTGYSSLSLLRQLPFEQLKIDRSFIQDFAGTMQDASFREARVVMEGVTAIARGLGLKVTAEGVETEDQLALLCDLGCDKVQGFLLGRPVPAAEAAGWLAPPLDLDADALESGRRP